MKTAKQLYWNDPLLIIGVVISLFFIGYTFLAGWSLTWPTVTGTIIGTQIKEVIELHRFRNLRLYLLRLTYTYEFDSIKHENTVAVDKFYSKAICNAAEARYKDKTIKVYVNPLDHKISTLYPGNYFINAFIASVLLAILTVFLFFIKPYKDKTEPKQSL